MSYLKMAAVFAILAAAGVGAGIYLGYFSPQQIRDEVAKRLEEEHAPPPPAPDRPGASDRAPEKPASDKAAPEQSASAGPADDGQAAAKLAAEQAAVERRQAANVALGAERRETRRDAARSDEERDLIRVSKLELVKHLEYWLDASSPWLDTDIRFITKAGEVRLASKVKAKNDADEPVTLPWRTRFYWLNGRWDLRYLEIDGHVYVSPNSQSPSVGEPAEAKQAKLAARAQDAAKAKESAAKNRPAAAASWLKTAQGFKESGKEDLYQKWLRKVVDDYPDTDAGAEAQSLLAAGTVAVRQKNESSLRTWTAAASDRTLEAQMVSLDGDTVTLRRKDGKVIAMPLAKLSQTDQDFARAENGAPKPEP